MCLARAILNESKIVVMDEATANVDHQTDEFIQNMIREVFRESTLLIIAHRLRTIIDSDKIIVMEEGVCKELGSPYELAYDENSVFMNYMKHTGEEECNYLLKKIRRNAKHKQ